MAENDKGAFSLIPVRSLLNTSYSVAKKIQSNLTEENIKLYFDKYELENYDISDLDLTDSNSELVKIIESISVETLEDKNIINDGIVINRQKDFLNDGKDRSKCFIF